MGIRFSPLGTAGDIADKDPEATFGNAARLADAFDLAYVHLVEPAEPKPSVAGDDETQTVFAAVREAFDGPLMANGNYDVGRANEAIAQGYADLVAFGRAFLANPDLPRRLEKGLPINVPNEDTFYNGDAHGYTDYPTWEELQNGASFETIDSLRELPSRG